MNQVVCIKDGPWKNMLGEIHSGPAPAYNQIYTIVGHVEWCGMKFYELAEISYGQWDSVFFKPVKKTDISTFTGLLKTKTNELEDA